MVWVTKITGSGANDPSVISVGDDVVISLVKSESGAIKVVIDAPPEVRIQKQRDGAAPPNPRS
jgi:hypothetical protein